MFLKLYYLSKITLSPSSSDLDRHVITQTHFLQSEFRIPKSELSFFTLCFFSLSNFFSYLMCFFLPFLLPSCFGFPLFLSLAPLLSFDYFLYYVLFYGISILVTSLFLFFSICFSLFSPLMSCFPLICFSKIPHSLKPLLLSFFLSVFPYKRQNKTLLFQFPLLGH